jgi:S-adenosylmethionine decarboxylase proenzyme
MDPSTTVGIHYIIDIDDVDAGMMIDNDNLIKICDKTLEIGEVHILKRMIHPFEPHGLTLLYLLTESHFSMHTWPEYQKIRIDFFSCEKNENRCNIVIEHLKNEFKGATFKTKLLRS